MLKRASREPSQSGRSEAVIRVMVAEDNFYTRAGTVSFLSDQVGIAPVGEATDGESALALFEQLRPDVLVADLRMPRMGGIELTSRLCARSPEARVLVLTHHQGDEEIFQALKAGARGYLTKESPGEELLAAIRAVHAGRRFVPPEILAKLRSRDGLPRLTQREREVLGRVAEGASNREVGAALQISERTVGVYVSSILSKLGACSRTEAVSIASRRGLLPNTST
jgi:two-component system, NarL family, response regulator